jgi:signal peptidase I
MNTDFTAILAILTLVSGAIWALDVWFFAKRRALAEADAEATEDKTTKEPILVEYARFLFPVFLVVLVIRGFIVEPFKIPSGSMLPTLEVGDFILVNKFSYGIRSPIGYHKLVDLGSPERGDVIVFRYPEDPAIDYIKRVIAVPGDRISYKSHKLYINGEYIETSLVSDYEKDRNFFLLLENLPGISHHILISKGGSFIPDVEDVVVPQDRYFVMGDNRDNSRDSRYWGFVPDSYLKGRAFFIWFSMEEWFDVKWSRIGNIIE